MLFQPSSPYHVVKKCFIGYNIVPGSYSSLDACLQLVLLFQGYSIKAAIGCLCIELVLIGYWWKINWICRNCYFMIFMYCSEIHRGADCWGLFCAHLVNLWLHFIIKTTLRLFSWSCFSLERKLAWLHYVCPRGFNCLRFGCCICMLVYQFLFVLLVKISTAAVNWDHLFSHRNKALVSSGLHGKGR